MSRQGKVEEGKSCSGVLEILTGLRLGGKEFDTLYASAASDEVCLCNKDVMTDDTVARADEAVMSFGQVAVSVKDYLCGLSDEDKSRLPVYLLLGDEVYLFLKDESYPAVCEKQEHV